MLHFWTDPFNSVVDFLSLLFKFSLPDKEDRKTRCSTRFYFVLNKSMKHTEGFTVINSTPIQNDFSLSSLQSDGSICYRESV